MFVVAFISAMKGRGFIYTEDEIYLLDLRRMYQPALCKGGKLKEAWQVYKWMDGAEDIRVKEFENETHPFRSIYFAMNRTSRLAIEDEETREAIWGSQIVLGCMLEDDMRKAMNQIGFDVVPI